MFNKVAILHYKLFLDTEIEIAKDSMTDDWWNESYFDLYISRAMAVLDFLQQAEVPDEELMPLYNGFVNKIEKLKEGRM